MYIVINELVYSQTTNWALRLPLTRDSEDIMSTEVYYRVTIDGFAPDVSLCGPIFGRIEARHNDWLAADRAKDAANKKLKGKGNNDYLDVSAGRAGQVVLAFALDEKLEVGLTYPALIHQEYSKKRFDDQAYRVKVVLEKMRTGEPLGDSTYCFDEYGQEIDFDAWLDRFSERANQMLEIEEQKRQDAAAEQARRQSVISSFDAAASEVTYSFAAVKGIQAGKEFYIAQVPYRYLVKFFTFADESVPAELRAQRKVNPKHAADISKYVVENRESYVLPPLTVSVNAAMQFDALDVSGLADRLGVLRIPCDCLLLINDGQHRRSAAESFIQVDPSLKNETIPVVFYYDEGLERSKQMFADINSNLSKPSAAINALYDLRNGFNRFVLKALERHSINNLVDKEATTIGATSSKVWSLVHWKRFVMKLFSVTESSFNELPDDQVERYHRYFDLVIEGLINSNRQWQLVLEGQWTSEEMRANSIAGHAVYLESIAVALSGFSFTDESQVSMLEESLKTAIAALRIVNTSKDAVHWQNRCVVAGRMAKSVDNVKLTAAYLREVMGLQLSESMNEVIARHQQLGS